MKKRRRPGKQWKARGKVGRYRHYAKKRAGKFDKRSIRTIRVGKHGRLIRVGCPKGQWKRGKCRAGMRALSMLVPAKNPGLTRRAHQSKEITAMRKHGYRYQKRGVGGRHLSVPEQHQLRIARDTLRYSDVGAHIMGGMTKPEAREVIARLTGRRARGNNVGRKPVAAKRFHAQIRAAASSGIAPRLERVLDQMEGYIRSGKDTTGNVDALLRTGTAIYMNMKRRGRKKNPRARHRKTRACRHRRNPMFTPCLLDAIRPGDTVHYWVYAGQGMRGLEYKQAKGRAVMRGPAGWVLNTGGRYGTPAVVGEKDIIQVVRRGRR